MLSNNGYVRGEYAVIGNTAIAGTKLSQYSKEDEYTKHYLTTKEYVDSKVKGNSVFSVKSAYTHTESSGSITAYTTGNDIDGKNIVIAESLTSGGGYIIKSSNDYILGILDNASGQIGLRITLELGQQLYNELDNQLYTIVKDNNNLILVPEMLSKTLTLSESSTDIFDDDITFDKLYNNTIFHKLTLKTGQTIDFSSTTSKIYDISTIPSTSTSLDNYKKNLINKNDEIVSKQLFTMYSYSGIPLPSRNNNEITINGWALLFETDATTHKYTAMFEYVPQGGSTTITDVINVSYDTSTSTYTNLSSDIHSTTDRKYILIDYYNHHTILATYTNSTTTLSVNIDDSNITSANYYQDLSLLVELTITKTTSSNADATYNYVFKAISSPDKQNIIGWATIDPLVLISTYKPCDN